MNMSKKNEYANYSREELTIKGAKYKKLQIGMIAMSVIFSLIIALASYVKGSETGYQIIPILLLAGTIYPLLTFGSMRKKIMQELNSRNT